jgi:hypothetical protein
MLCEWRRPREYSLKSLRSDLAEAIAHAEEHSPAHARSRLRQWEAQLGDLAATDFRATAIEMADALKIQTVAAKARGAADDDTEVDVWQFPMRDAFRSLLDARMYVYTVQRLRSKLQPSDWRKLSKGHLRPEDEKDSAPHRDLLLELYIAAAAEAAQLEPLLVEPDVSVFVGGERVGIAVKRIQSRKKVKVHAEKAADQIQASGVERGIIVLDVSNIMNRRMTAIRYLRPTKDFMDGSVHPHLMAFVSEHRALLPLLERAHVEGILLRHAVPVMFAPTFTPGTLETWSSLSDNPSPLTAAIATQLLDALAPQGQPRVGALPSRFVPCEFSFFHS